MASNLRDAIIAKVRRRVITYNLTDIDGMPSSERAIPFDDVERILTETWHEWKNDPPTSTHTDPVDDYPKTQATRKVVGRVEPSIAAQGPTREELACALRYVLSFWNSITHIELPNGSPLRMTFPRADEVLTRYDATQGVQMEPQA